MLYKLPNSNIISTGLILLAPSVYKLIISGYVRNISGGLHHENPFTFATNLPPTAFKCAMFFASALI